MKKFLSLLLSALLAVSFVVSASAAENVVDDGVQESAVAAYDELMASFATTYSNSGEKIYPDYYGGSYINDAGQLIVYVTDNVQRPAVLSDNANVVYEPCTYSYNELLSVMDTLNNYKFSRSNDATIVMVLHDLNHAIMFSDYLVAIKDGTLHSAGTPQEVITQQALREIFDVEAEVITHPVLNVPVCLPFRITEQNKKTGGSNT